MLHTAHTPDAPRLPDWLDRTAFPFAGSRVRLADGEVHVTDHGTGPTVLLVHGTPTWSFEWRHVIRDLSRDHRCVALDHLGFGLSARPEEAGYAPEDHARRLRELVEKLDLRDVTLVVHDFGGPIGLPLALEGGLVRRLVVVNSFGWPPDEDPGIRRAAALLGGALGRLLYRFANLSLRVILPSAYGDRARLTRAVHEQYLAPFRHDREGRVRVLWALARGLRSSAPFYRELWSRRAALARKPAVVIWGTRDPAFPPRLAARWREAIPGAEIVPIEGAGHWPHEERPDEVVAALRRFLAGP